MKDSSFRFRILRWGGIAGLLAVWYALARLFVFIQASNHHRACLDPYVSSWQQYYCHAGYVSAPSYSVLTYDRFDNWMYGGFAAVILLGGTFILGGLILALTLNGKFGRPLYSFLHIKTYRDERNWRGKRKRRHALIVIRD